MGGVGGGGGEGELRIDYCRDATRPPPPQSGKIRKFEKMYMRIDLISSRSQINLLLSSSNGLPA